MIKVLKLDFAAGPSVIGNNAGAALKRLTQNVERQVCLNLVFFSHNLSSKETPRGDLSSPDNQAELPFHFTGCMDLNC